MRYCNECGRYMTRGYCIENGLEYYCCEDCLDKHYTEDEYLSMHDDGEGDSYYTTWDDEIEQEKEFLKDRINNNDFFGFIKAFNERGFNENIKFEDVLDRTLDYCLYDGYFNPYYDKEYIDVMYAKNHETGLIYNMDDIFDIYYEILNDIENEREVAE